MNLQDELVCYRYSTLKVCNRVSPEPPNIKEYTCTHFLQDDDT